MLRPRGDHDASTRRADARCPRPIRRRRRVNAMVRERLPRQQQRVRRDRTRLRRGPRGVDGGEHPPRRVHLRADAVRPRRRRAVVPRVRRHRPHRADGADVGAVDPLPAPGDRRRRCGRGRRSTPPAAATSSAPCTVWTDDNDAKPTRRRPGHLRPAGIPSRHASGPAARTRRSERPARHARGVPTGAQLGSVRT